MKKSDVKRLKKAQSIILDCQSRVYRACDLVEACGFDLNNFQESGFEYLTGLTCNFDEAYAEIQSKLEPKEEI